MTDSFDPLISEFVRPLIERVRREAYAEGHSAALASFAQFAQSQLQTTQYAPEPVRTTIVPSEKITPRNENAPSKRTRAPNGQIPKIMRENLLASPNGTNQADLIRAASDRNGIEIAPSSARVALHALERDGVAERRDGQWFPKGNGVPLGTPPFNAEPSEQAATTAGKEDAP